MERDEFLSSYIETALWSETDDNGIPLNDARHCYMELTGEAIAIMKTDCDQFQVAIENLGLEPTPQHFHDFWLTRNRHGAGFWDGDYPEPLATKLTKLAHSFPECHLYIGDDGRIDIE